MDGEREINLKTIREVDRLIRGREGEMRSLKRLPDLWIEHRVNGGASQAGNAKRENETNGWGLVSTWMGDNLGRPVAIGVKNKK